MTDDLWDIFGGGGGSEAKAFEGVPTGVAVGDTTNLPANWTEFQDSLWETLTFQQNLPDWMFRSRSDAVGLSLATQCADVKARDIAKVDIALWRRGRDRRWEEVLPKEHWLAKMLARKPNSFHTWTEFWRMVVIHLELTQNAYILIEEQRDGTVTGLWPMPTARCRPRITEDRKLFYEISARTNFDRAVLGDDYMIVPARRMIHLKGRMYDGLCGLSNADLGDPIFNLLNAISRFQTQLFGNDGRQPIVFESDTASFGVGDQADAAFRRLKNQLTERVRKMNSNGDPILLEAGYKAKIIAQNARDAMTADAFNATVMRVCGLMQTPPHKIFAYESIKYDNQASADNQYANDCLKPIARNIEEKFKLDLLTEDEWDDLALEFDRMGLMAGDPKTLAEILDKAVKNGAIEIDEYRDRMSLNLGPLPNETGQVRYVPVNMAIVDRDGNIVQQAASGQPKNDGTTENPPQPSNNAPALVATKSEQALLAAVTAFGEAAKALARPVSVTVPITMPSKGREVTTVSEIDDAGVIRKIIKEYD